MATARTALAQVQGAVYLDDSPAAQEGIARAGELAAVGNLEEAVRVLQRVLDDQGDQVTPTPGDADLFTSVRRRVHEAIAANPKLLDRYRLSEEVSAKALLDTAQFEKCERTKLLTTAGYDAALRVAQRELEAARFFGAWQVLRQLDAHPDRTAERAKLGLSLLRTVAGYLKAEHDTSQHVMGDIDAAMTRWCTAAGESADAPTAVEIPSLERDRTVFDVGAPVNLDGLLPRPLASEFLGRPIEGVHLLSGRTGQRGVGEQSSVLHALPTVAGDSVYVNDSETITAWDRFTLSRRWRAQVEPPASLTTMMTTGLPGIEDCNTVAVEGNRLATVSGLAMVGRQGSERVVSVLDTRDGRVLWSVTLSELGVPALGECTIRGPVVIDQGLVIVGAARQSMEKRLQGSYLAALDVETGELRWARNLGSVGAVPWGMSGWPADASLVDGGVVYRSDHIGSVSAVEAASGRVIWIRRLAPENQEQSYQQANRVNPWENNAPVVDGSRLLILSPDKRTLVALDAATGALQERVTSSRLANPDYLLLMPGQGNSPSRLIGVGTGSVDVMFLKGPLGSAPVRKLAAAVSPGIRGRVTLNGNQLFVPMADGVRAVTVPVSSDPSEAAPIHVIKLNSTGQTLAMESQFLVVDDSRVHSYLLWDVAHTLLSERMKAAVHDPAPAITFAELSYQAGKHENLIGAIDRAMKVIESDPLSTTNEASRKRLFGAMLEMVEPSPDSATLARLSDDLRRQVVDRLQQSAATPGEQVSALMAAGRFAEGSNQAGQAIEHYQTVLLTPALASERYARNQTTLPAATEATRRIRRLVRERGRGIYAAYEAEAIQQLEQASAGEEGQLEELARKYPVASAAPRAWLLVAERQRAKGRELQSITALEEGLAAAEDALAAGDPLLGELAGRLVTQTAATGRARAALRALDDVERRLGSAAMTANGQSIDRASLRASLGSRLADAERRARIGVPTGAAVAIPGWGILNSIMGDAPGAPTDHLMMSSAAGEIGMWKIAPATPGGGQPTLVKLWTDTVSRAMLRMDARTVLLAKASNGAAGLEQSVSRRDLETGAVLWESPSFRSLFTEPSRRPTPTGEARIETPTRQNVPLNELMALGDDRTLVLVERTGRAAGFDLDSGKLLWAGELGVEAVYDAAMADGVLVVGGTPIGPGAPAAAPDEVVKIDAAADAAKNDAGGDAGAEGEGDAGASAEGAVFVVEARSGQTILAHREADKIRWTRMTVDGQVLVGGDSGVLLLDPARKTVKWRTDAPATTGSFNAWPLPGRALLRDSDKNLWQLDLETGAIGEKPLDTREKTERAFIDPDVRAVGDHAVFASARGILIYDRAGKLIGADTLGGDSIFVPARMGESVAVLVEQSMRTVRVADSPAHYAMHTVSLDGGKELGELMLELPREPGDVALLDGLIVVSAGSSSVVLQAPASGGK